MSATVSRTSGKRRWSQLPRGSAPTRADMLDAMDAAERSIRDLATRWRTRLDGLTRWLLLRAANQHLALLVQTGRR